MKNLAKAATLGAGMLLLSKILGFLREICLAYQFGTSYIVDAYTACIALPSVLFGVYAYGFADAYIPSYMRVREGQARKDFFNNVLTFLLLISLLIVTLCWFFCEPLTTILAPGFDERSRVLLSQFIRIISVIFPILTANSLLSAQIQTGEDFLFLQFCEYIVVNVLVIVTILVSSVEAPYTLVVGYVLSYLVAVILLAWYAVRKKGVTYRPCLQLRNPYFTALCTMAIPLGASRLVNELNGVADRMFASLLGEGVTSALSYANKVQLLFYTLTTSIFITVCYPRINRRFAEGDREGGMYYIRKAVLVALYVSLPVMGGLFLFSTPLVSLLFERGMFSASSTTMTAGCLAFYALGIPFYALREIGSRALAANLAQRRILKNTIISVACNILLNLALLRPLGYIGLALATSVTGAVTCILILFDLRKLNLQVFKGELLRDLVKIAAASAVSLLLCGCCYRGLTGVLGEGLAIIPGVCAAGAAYLVLSVVLRIGIFVWVYQHLPAKLRVLPWLNGLSGDQPDNL